MVDFAFILMHIYIYIFNNTYNIVTVWSTLAVIKPNLLLEKIGKMRHFKLLFVTIVLLIFWTILDNFYPILHGNGSGYVEAEA